MNRRKFILGTGAGAISALAGCSSISNPIGGSSEPSYVQAIPPTLTDEGAVADIGFQHMDVDAAIGLNSEGEQAATPTPTDDEVDPATALGVVPVLDAQGGAGNTLSDVSDDAGWALRNGSNHLFAYGTIAPESGGAEGNSDFDPVGNTALADVPRRMQVSGVSYEQAGASAFQSLSADTAIVHTGEDLDSSVIRETYADSEGDISVSTNASSDSDGQRVSIAVDFSTLGLPES